MGLDQAAVDTQFLDMIFRRTAECTISFYHTRPNGER